MNAKTDFMPDFTDELERELASNVVQFKAEKRTSLEALIAFGRLQRNEAEDRIAATRKTCRAEIATIGRDRKAEIARHDAEMARLDDLEAETKATAARSVSEDKAIISRVAGLAVA